MPAALLLLAACSVGSAQTFSAPSCIPTTAWTPFGTGSDLVNAQAVAGGVSVSSRGWWCPQPDGSWVAYVHLNVDSAEWSAKAVTERLTSAMRSSDRLAALQSAVMGSTRLPTAAEAEAWNGALDALKVSLAARKPPDVIYRVKVNGTSTTRPAYMLANGVRGTTSVGRATVGERCLTGRPTLASGSDLWAEFGPANAPGVIALCARAP